jgi:glutathione S-transferase
MKRSICALGASIMLLGGMITGSTAVHAAADAAKPALTIYHVEGRRSQRVIWLCEELGIPCQLSFKRGDILGSMDAIRAVNPLMPVAPTVRIDDTVMVESGAILVTPNVFPGVQQPLVGSLEVLKFAEAHLAEHPYFGGASFSAADIMMHLVAVMASNLPGVDMTQYPLLVAWRQTLETRPAFLRASAAALRDGKAPDGRGIPAPKK